VTAVAAGNGFTRNTDQTTIARCSNDGLARVRIATKRPPAAFAIAAALIGMFVVSRAVAAPSNFDGVWLPDVKDQKRQETQNVPPWKPEIVPQIQRLVDEERRAGLSWSSAIACRTACRRGC
jgi:hypothetical protein